MNVQPNIPNPQNSLPRLGAKPVHFGAGMPVPPMEGATKVVDNVFNAVMPNRTWQLLVEDLLGFGLLRTGMDLWRGKAYGNDQMNFPAAGERMGRETASILTDNVLAGVVAYGLGRFIFDKTKLLGSNKVAAFNNKFVDFPTLEAFQGAAKQSVTKADFVKNLVNAQFDEPHREVAKTYLDKAWTAGEAKGEDKQLTRKLENWAADLSKSIKVDNAGGKEISNLENGFTYARKANPESILNLNSLLTDVHGFSQHMSQLAEAKTGKSWQNLAEESIKRTIKAKNITIPVGLGLAMAATFAVPFAISGISRKFFNIDYYPGEIGLRQEDDKTQPQAKKSFWEKHAPYLTQSIKNGNYGPLAVTLAPLALAAGVLNTTRLGKYGVPVVVKSLKEWKHLFDFQKGAPWTAQQQMSSLFALLITARLLNSRSDNEYRERVLDSFVGWGAWIMGTPLLNKLAANGLDKFAKTNLVKADGSLRTRTEIEALSKLGSIEGAVVKRTLQSHIWMNVATTCTTMVGLGLVIPWMGIKLTQNNENRKKQVRADEAAQKAQAQRPAQMPQMSGNPFGVQSQAMPFNSMPNFPARPGLFLAPGLSKPRSPWVMPPVGQRQA